MTREIPLTRGMVALIDDDDWELVSAYEWRLHGDEDPAFGLYVVATDPDGDGRQVVRLHRLIMRAGPVVVVDHRSGDTLDNRRANLRNCSVAENAMNRRPNRGTKTGLKGVSPLRGKYLAQITLGGKARYLGYFGDQWCAALAYDDAAVEMFGEFARLNFDRDRDWIVGGRSVGLGAQPTPSGEDAS